MSTDMESEIEEIIISEYQNKGGFRLQESQSYKRAPVRDMRPLNVEVKEEKGKTCLLIEIEPSVYIGLDLKPDLIGIIGSMLKTWGKKVFDLFDMYDKERGKIYFLYDIEKLASCIQNLNDVKDVTSLTEAGDYTQLFHNRHLAQLMMSYRSYGNTVDLDLLNRLPPKRHDFNVNDVPCEVKTVQSLACIDLSQGHVRFEPKSLQKLFQNLRDDISDALKQVGNKGIVFIAFWCLGTNFLLHEYFGAVSPRKIPSPDRGNIVLKFTVSARPDGEPSDRYIVIPTSMHNEVLDDLYNFLLNTQLVSRSIFIPMTPPDMGNLFFRSAKYLDMGTRMMIKFS